MNRSALKKYAPQARLDFIEAVTLRARRLGLDPTLPVNVEQNGDVLLIGGQPFPASIAKQRATLAQRIQQQGFTVVVEALAYTWFNRLIAIRFMELKDYLSHGYRVLSHPQGQQPEILDHVQHLDLFGLDKAEVIRLKTAGNQDEVLYREILLAQCHELHRNMPFLFEALDDATELLLPDNLLRTDSPIARLVRDVEEGDWQEVEVIGWLYQFYISEKKDEVIGKVVKSEDIPAATQLFTPNWIVQYLVQNSLGRLWLMANPGSSLKDKMPYYIEPAEQTPEVQAQLDALIKVRMDEDGGTLSPESLTVLDPACGSGHILVEAYNLLRAIYEERGYRLRDIPRLILQKNIFGLDIDERAAQLAGFALLMKAREDDRRLFNDEGNPPRLNVMAIQQSVGLPDKEIADAILSAAIRIDGGEEFHSDQLFGGGQLETLHSSGLVARDLRELIQLFEYGKTFGSLIRVPGALKANLDKIIELLLNVRREGDDLSRSYANQVLEQFAWPASILAISYDAIVANPPYMGGKGMNSELKSFAKKYFPESKSDLFSMFTDKLIDDAKGSGFVALMTPFVWMFLSSYEALRKKILNSGYVSTLVRPEYHSFFESAFVPICAFVVQKNINGECGTGVFFDLGDFYGYETQPQKLKEAIEDPTLSWRYEVNGSDFKIIPGWAIAYWLSHNALSAFDNCPALSEKYEFRQGLATGDNDRFLRFWHECDIDRIGFGFDDSEKAIISGRKWFPCNKGGESRKWYGNNYYVVDWENDGERLKAFPGSVIRNPKYYFRQGVTWGSLTVSALTMRYSPPGFIFESKGAVAFEKEGEDLNLLLSLANSKVMGHFLKVLAPTMDYSQGPVGKVPLNLACAAFVSDITEEAVEVARNSWDRYEISWDFNGFIFGANDNSTLSVSWDAWNQLLTGQVQRMKVLEEKNNQIFIDAYGLQEELSPAISESEITLARSDRGKDMLRLISYAVGCMMGRYSLDEPGLIYARSGGVGFDPIRYRKFPADADGIIPISDEPWFEDDIAERIRDFVKVVWGGDTLVENIEWLADSLDRKAGESADEVIRRYLSTSFYKDHMQTYKKRPIYWLFSSGKQKAFECLVYLHRYNEGTLSRMRMEYVVPLQSRMQARIDKLADDINSATGSAQQKALQKRKDKFTKQLEELRRFDETLRPYADQRIALNLDDGVKVNYGKFGDLLAEVKAITGGKED